MTHTPGPWFASGTDVKPLGDRPFICWTGTPERDLPEARANAALIAAAPDMLAALEAFIRSRKGDGMGWTLDSLEAIARDAIAKAKGGA